MISDIESYARGGGASIRAVAESVMGLGLGVEGRPLIVETHRHETTIMTGRGRLFVSFGGSNRDVKDDVNSFVLV